MKTFQISFVAKDGKVTYSCQGVSRKISDVIEEYIFETDKRTYKVIIGSSRYPEFGVHKHSSDYWEIRIFFRGTLTERNDQEMSVPQNIFDICFGPICRAIKRYDESYKERESEKMGDSVIRIGESSITLNRETLDSLIKLWEA